MNFSVHLSAYYPEKNYGSVQLYQKELLNKLKNFRKEKIMKKLSLHVSDFNTTILYT